LNFKFFILALTFIIIAARLAFSQAKTGDSLRIRGDTLDASDDRTIEKLIENQTTDVEDSELLDYLKKLESNPLDLNSVTEKDLEKIPFISAVISKNIVQFRTNHKNFSSVGELKLVNGIDDDLYKKISRFLSVSEAKHDYKKDELGRVEKINSSGLMKAFDFHMRNRFTNDLQPSIGFLDTAKGYKGSRPKIYNRLEMKYSLKSLEFSGGMVSEKDPGETKLFDFIGGYAEMKGNGFIDQALIGDYTLEFGQGMTLWSSVAFSKGNDAVATIKKYGEDIDSYNSVNEIQYFRGGASKLKLSTSLGDLNFYGFYSYHSFDATIDSTLGEVSTVYYDGYHRTLSELKRKNSVKEKLYGGRLFYESTSAKFGLTYYRSFFDRNFEVKDLYDFSGNKTNGLGGDYDIIYKNINLFGEWARSYNGSIGGLSGARALFFSEKMSVDIIVLVRNYPKDFIMLHSYGFGEQRGLTQNEFGIYSGIKFKVPGFVTIDAYIDQYKFPYRTFYKPVPTKGRDFLFYTEWKLSHELSLYTRYKNENKENVITIPDEFGHGVDRIFARAQNNYRLQFDYDISKTFRVRSRFEYSFVDNAGFKTSEKGIMFFSDFRVKPFTGFLVDGRFIIFQTDSYDSRIYEYENEVDGVIYNPALYGKGRRWYLIIKYEPLDYLQLSAKYSETYFDGVKSIGSGNDEVIGDFKNRFAIQLDLEF
jgi:helix-hairpin-helix protein